MKQTINVLIVEDSKYYNNLLSKALQQSIRLLQKNHGCKMVLYSFTDSHKCIRKIKSGAFEQYDTIAFIDYYLGDGINGAHIIKLLKEQNRDVMTILLSQSKAVEARCDPAPHDYFMVKDTSAVALCQLYLEQYIEKSLDSN